MGRTFGDIQQQLSDESDEPSSKRKRIEKLSLNEFPNELLLLVFELRKPTPSELAELGSVCKLWHRISRESGALKAALGQLSDDQIYRLFEKTVGGFSEIIEIQDEYPDSDDEEFQKKTSDFFAKTCPTLQANLEILLLDERITINTTYGANEQTLCHFVVFHLDYLISWLQEKGADLNATNKNGETPLHVALQHLGLDPGNEGYADLVAARELLKYKINANIQDKSGATPLHRLAKFAYVEQLSDDGQKDFKNFLNELAKKGADFKIKERLTNSAPWQIAAAQGNLILNGWLNELAQKPIAKQQEEMDNTVISNMSMR